MSQSDWSTPPIFIGACGRSGTTMTVDLLGLHPLLSPVYETQFVVELIHNFYQNTDSPLNERIESYRRSAYDWSKCLENPPHNKRQHERYHHGYHYYCFDADFFRERTDQFIARLSNHPPGNIIPDYIRDIFQRHAENDGKPFWINKTPVYIYAPTALLDWFPNLKLIHTIRDLRAVVASMKECDWAPEQLDDKIERWEQAIHHGRDFGNEHPDQYIEVRYESLVKHPKSVIRGILNQLSPNLAEDASERAEEILQNGVDMDPTRLNSWKSSLTSDEVERIHDHAGDWLTELGYD